jgi:hypothetical protein
MPNTIRFCLVLHNHQPIGNFDSVFEEAYQDSYRPFLDLFEQYSDLCFSLHTSGPLMEWLSDNHPEYVDRLAELVRSGRVEIVGGAFHEPILTMLPSRDRIGQISSYTTWLQDRLGADVNGMWVAERVWEQTLTSDIVRAGIRYTILDDFHFRNAGLTNEQLHGYYVTEDEGSLLSVFPGSERLRYLIPFCDPEQTIEYLRDISEQHPNSVVVFGDDGEKFGTWPDTKKHVYEDGWLRRFFDALSANRDWLKMTTLAEATENVAPQGRIYIPDASYREMTEWALPVDKLAEYENVTHEMEHDPRWPRVQQFVRGGFWRNFKVKYPEANEMYARMMMVSRRLEQAELENVEGEEIEAARRELYRGQCNCSYWHGAFGGIYLPHLRNAVYSHLIAADNHLDRAIDKSSPWIEAVADDFNFDARQEVRLANENLVALIAPASGGHLYELDLRQIAHNLLATMTRRPEAYHRKVLAGANQDGGQVASIHDRVVFKQEGLDQRIQYDSYPRNSLVDHFFDSDATPEGISSGQAMERGDFALGVYETKLRRSSQRVQVLLSRDGNAWGIPLKITKGITLESDGAELEIAYLVEGLPKDKPFHFAVEFNFAGMPSGADDRYFYQADGTRLGQLGTKLDLHDVDQLGLVDQWLGIDAQLNINRPSGVWTFPIETVSQSEGGFELVHQSVVVMPHWHLQGDADGKWSVTMRLSIESPGADDNIASSMEAVATLSH